MARRTYWFARNLDAANIAYNLLKTAAGRNVAIGPVLLGCAAPAHILTPSATVRRIVDMIALTVVETNARQAVTPSTPLPPLPSLSFH